MSSRVLQQPNSVPIHNSSQHYITLMDFLLSGSADINRNYPTPTRLEAISFVILPVFREGKEQAEAVEAVKNRFQQEPKR